MVFAKSNPQEFLNTLDDPDLKYQAKVRLFFESKLLTFRNNDREVWFNTTSNKKKMMSIPFGEDPYDAVAIFLQSDEGLDALKMLELSLG